MGNISRLISERIGVPIQTEVSDASGQYHMFNSGGVECEVGEFLYSLMLLMKPKAVLETGTHLGIASSYIGLGLKENGFGILDTVEFSEENLKVAKKNWLSVGIDGYVTSHLMDIRKFEAVKEYDVALLDTEPHLRFGELVRFYPKVRQGGVLIIHDLPYTFCQGNVSLDHPEFKDHPFGPVPEEMKNLLKDQDLVPFHFPNPRGMVAFYKHRPDDYRP